MSGIDQFLSQHYGTAYSGPTEEDMAKVAQAEMFLKLASQHNIDLNQLSDSQVNELWAQVWSEKTAEDEAEERDEKARKAKKEHDEAKEEAKEGQEKFAEADYMGRIMAHSYVNELRGLAEQGDLEFMKSADGASGEEWAARNNAAKSPKKGGKVRAAADWVGGKAKAVGSHIADNKKYYIPGAIGAAALAGGAAYLHHRSKKNEEESSKESSALDEYAANYAVEKAAACGFNPEEAAERVYAVMVLGPDESDKIAYVEGIENAVDVRSSELLELAGYPIDWGGTPFEKSADGAGGEEWVARNHSAKSPKEEWVHAATPPPPPKEGGKVRAAADWVGGKAKAVGSHIADNKKYYIPGAIGAAALAGGAAYLHHRSKKNEEESSKESSVRFDLAAAELALEKAASTGWDPNEAIERINSLFNLGYEGDPAQSEKVAYAQNGDQALNFRACELLELAGYRINW